MYDLPMDVRAAIDRSGYFPDIVADALSTSLGSESVMSFVVQHEATFDHDELRRHVTVLLLTPTRLIVGHTDDHPPVNTEDVSYATTAVEAVRLNKVDSVVLTRVVADPQKYTSGGAAHELVLTIGWGAVSRIELEPASCGDPACEADHGYTGNASNDDFSMRVSAAADGAEVVSQVLAFAEALSSATSVNLHG
ncbi:MAG: hypothetical protein RJB01_1440 [Actinomycetota bacterium]